MGIADRKREQIVEKLAEVILENGLAAASLRNMAASAGTSDRMLLYYFKDKSDILVSVFSQLSERMAGLLTASVSQHKLNEKELFLKLKQEILSEQMWPYMKLWLEIVSHASRGDSFYAQAGENIGRFFFEWVRSQLKVSKAEQLDQRATNLLLKIEGMAIFKAVGLQEICEFSS